MRADSADRLRLDGNALGGLLAEIFQSEITLAQTTCAHCGLVKEFGAQVVYRSAMGTIVRCIGCDSALIRLAQGRGRSWLDLRGMSCLQVDGPD